MTAWRPPSHRMFFFGDRSENRCRAVQLQQQIPRKRHLLCCGSEVFTRAYQRMAATPMLPEHAQSFPREVVRSRPLFSGESVNKFLRHLVGKRQTKPIPLLLFVWSLTRFLIDGINEHVDPRRNACGQCFGKKTVLQQITCQTEGVAICSSLQRA